MFKERLTARMLPVALLGCFCFADPVAAQEEAAPPEKESVAKSAAEKPTGKEALKQASRLRRRSFKKKGEEKRKILLEALAAYRGVMESHAEDRNTFSTAALRAADLCRSLDQREEALALYETVADSGGPDANGARALNEIAHILRRARRLDEALQAYRTVLDRFPGESNAGTQSLIWIGKIHAERKSATRAREAWRELLTRFEEPRKRLVEVYDLLARSHLDSGEVDAARAVLAECRERFASSFESEKKADLAVVKAIRSMKAAARLEKLGTSPPGAPPAGVSPPDKRPAPDGGSGLDPGQA